MNNIENLTKQFKSFQESDPINLLRSFMKEHKLKAQDLTTILGISKGYVSDILNYKNTLVGTMLKKNINNEMSIKYKDEQAAKLLFKSKDFR